MPSAPNTNAATGGIPPALLAILASAANAASSNPPPAPAPAPAPVQPSLPNLTTAPNPPPNGQATQYSAAQLALIQQLAIAGGIVPQAKAPSEVSPSAPSPTSAISPVNGSNHPYNSSYEYRGRGGPPGRQYSSRDDYRGDDYYESDQRGGYHGGDSYRGRGRGRGRGDFGFRGGRDGNWSDRDGGGGRPPYRGGHYESRRGGGFGRGRGGWANHGNDDGDDVPYQRRSRSRSPPPRRGGEGHDSPSDRNRPGYDSPRRRGIDSSRDDPGRMVDDFGREIRPDVEEEASPEAKTQPLPPSNWEALGKSFQVTNGYVPSQEELMAIVMMAMQTMQAAAMNQQWQQQEGWDMQQGSFDGDASAGDQMAGGGYANGQNQDAMNTDAPELSDETAAPTSNENGTSGATKPRATKDPRLAGRDKDRDPSPSADRDMSLSPPDSPSD
ncbi:hypothetical protein DL93DRAFT_1979314 [Clavulina sp. PMI_390]|nr:hypothetical protein DL93DRAFT_1979314 [Clavulina sp. PMI_390]